MKTAIKKMVLGYPVLIHPDSPSGFWVECRKLQGCYTQGETVEDAINNIKEVIQMCLEDEREQKVLSKSGSCLKPLAV